MCFLDIKNIFLFLQCNIIILILFAKDCKWKKGYLNNYSYNKCDQFICRNQPFTKKITGCGGPGLAYNKEENGWCWNNIFNRSNQKCVTREFDIQNDQENEKQEKYNNDNNKRRLCKIANRTHGCFNGKSYDYNKEYICYDMILKFKEEQCCEKIKYNPKNQTCCFNELKQKQVVIHDNPYACHIENIE